LYWKDNFSIGRIMPKKRRLKSSEEEIKNLS
jgi:hypothetical protein